MTKTLVLCIGNKSRGDDGVARRVAELIEDHIEPDVSLVSQPQLDVVLAEDVAAASAVVFVDAERRTTPPVTVSEVIPDIAGSNVHSLDPAGLLSLAHVLYGRLTPALLVSVAAPNMEHGDSLTATAEAASHQAASEIMRILGSDTP